jgi:hypothetical protein
MKHASKSLSKSARNTAKLVAGGAIATASSQTLNAAMVVWDGTPFTLTGDANDNIPIQGYNSILNVQTAAKNTSTKTNASATLIGLGGAGLAFEDSGNTVDATTGFSSSLSLVDGEHYYGFSLPNGDTPLYGWLSATTANLNGTSSMPTFTLTGYAYDDTGAAIVIPEPSAMTMALLAGSAVLWRRRNRAADTAA